MVERLSVEYPKRRIHIDCTKIKANSIFDNKILPFYHMQYKVIRKRFFIRHEV